ncbi:MAG: SDR family NAD(P)-dependent oxidoreductase [Sulfobacillus sp.]
MEDPEIGGIDFFQKLPDAFSVDVDGLMFLQKPGPESDSGSGPKPGPPSKMWKQRTHTGAEIPFPSFPCPGMISLHNTTTLREYTLLSERLRQTPPQPPIAILRGMKQLRCYLCRRKSPLIHWFYHSCCHDCGESAWKNRYLSRDLSGQRAVVTGGRMKLGYQVALKLLRAGAEVYITSRCPEQALENYRQEPDWDELSQRLHVSRVPLDLQTVDRQLDQLLSDLQRVYPDGRIDILVQNASQTIRAVAEDEQELGNPNFGSRPSSAEEVNRAIDEQLNPALPSAHFTWQSVVHERDRYGRQLDRRERNTWGCHFGQIDPIEAREVLLANAWAPLLIDQALLPWLSKSRQGYLIHVHAREGEFYAHKTLCHAHTNMAKAGLSMLTRILAAPGIGEVTHDDQREHMHVPWANPHRVKIVTRRRRKYAPPVAIPLPRVHGVNPGWFSIDEYTVQNLIRMKMKVPPIDAIDAAARVLYPLWTSAPSFHGTWINYVPSARI